MNRFKKYFLTMAAMALFLLLSLGVFAYLRMNNRDISDSSYKQMSGTPTLISNQTIDKQSNFVITSDIDGEEKTVYARRITTTLPDDSFKILDGYLFVPAEQDSEKLLKRIHLATGAIDYFIDNTGQDDRIADTISGMEIINGKLIVLLSGYFEEPRSFVFNTGNSNPIEFKGYGNKISKIAGSYFLVSGSGDGCAGNSSFMFISPDTLTLTHVLDLVIGCPPGYNEIGVYNNYFIIADQLGGETAPNISRYKSLELQQLEPPFERIIVLDENTLPQNTHSMIYVEDQSKIIIGAESIYEYDLPKRTFSKIVDLPAEIKNSDIVKVGDGYVCTSTLVDSANYIFKKYRVSLTDGHYEEDEECKNAQRYIPQIRQEDITKEELLQYLEEFSFPDSVKVYFNDDQII